MDTPANGKLAYSIDECAAALGISKCLAYSLCKRGVIPTIRLGERRLVVPSAAQETRPSLSFHPEKGYKCFACSAKGGLRALAEHLGLEVGPLTVEQVAEAKG